MMWEKCEKRDEMKIFGPAPGKQSIPVPVVPTTQINGLSSRQSRLLRSRAGTPSSNPESPRSVEGLKSKTPISQSPLRLSSSRSSMGTAGYDSDDSVIRVDRAHHYAMQQDVMSIKTMLLKLKRVLHESEARNPLENGFFIGFSSDCDKESDEHEDSQGEENTNLRRQILFLQGQLEDKDRTVQTLQDQVVKLVSDYQSSHSAPASVTITVPSTCNAATQTDKLRPLSTGPSLLQGSPTDATPGSLVSVNERRSRIASTTTPQTTPPTGLKAPASPSGRLWRMPGEPPQTPQRFGTSSIPRRSCSRSRSGQMASSASTTS